MIDSFNWKYRFLSNFYIEMDGTSVEAEYQAAKCNRGEDYDRIIAMSSRSPKPTNHFVGSF